MIQEAVLQSCNIIIDLRHSKMIEEKAVKAYEREFQNSKGLRRMIIKKKDGELLDFASNGCIIIATKVWTGIGDMWVPHHFLARSTSIWRTFVHYIIIGQASF